MKLANYRLDNDINKLQIIVISNMNFNCAIHWQTWISPKMNVLGKTPYSIQWWGSNSGVLESVEPLLRYYYSKNQSNPKW